MIFQRLFSSLVRLIDAQGKNCGLVLKDSIAVPENYKLSEVATNVIKIVPIQSEPKILPIKLEKPKRQLITKELKLRPSIADSDLERKLNRIRFWLKASSKRIGSVNVFVHRDGGWKAKARGFTCETLMTKIQSALEKEGIKSGKIENGLSEIYCSFTKKNE